MSSDQVVKQDLLDTIREYQIQNQISKQEREILLRQIKDQQDYIIGMSNIHYGSAIKRIEVVQLLNYTQENYNKVNQQLIQVNQQYQNQIQVIVDQHKLDIAQLKFKHEQEIQTLRSLLIQREHILEQLQNQINTRDLNPQIEFIIDDCTQDTIPDKDYVQHLEQLIQVLERQIQNKDHIIVQSQQQIMQLQIKLPDHLQQMPEFLKQKLMQFETMKKFVGELMNQIALTNTQVEEWKQKFLQMHEMKKQIKKLEKSLKAYKKDLKQVTEQLEDNQSRLEDALSAGWAMRKFIERQFDKDKVLEICAYKVSTENLPFCTIKELISEYDRLRRWIFAVAQYRFDQL